MTAATLKLPAKGDKAAALYAILMSDELTDAAKKVAGALVWHSNAKTGRCDPGRARLAKEANLSLASVKRAIAKIDELGLIVRHQHAGAFKTNFYVVNWSRLRELCRRWEAVALGRAMSGEPAQDGLTADTQGGSNLSRGGLTAEPGGGSNLSHNRLTAEPQTLRRNTSESELSEAQLGEDVIEKDAAPLEAPVQAEPKRGPASNAPSQPVARQREMLLPIAGGRNSNTSKAFVSESQAHTRLMQALQEVPGLSHGERVKMFEYLSSSPGGAELYAEAMKAEQHKPGAGVPLLFKGLAAKGGSNGAQIAA